MPNCQSDDVYSVLPITSCVNLRVMESVRPGKMLFDVLGEFSMHDDVLPLNERENMLKDAVRGKLKICATVLSSLRSGCSCSFDAFHSHKA